MPTIAITSISARSILDSRGNPTVEVDVLLSDGSQGRASVPSGASTGVHEALELRDNNPDHFGGKSVEKAVANVNDVLAKHLLNNDPFDQAGLDNEMVLRDGTPTLQRTGANATLAVSLAVSKAAAASLKLPYYRYIHHLYQSTHSQHANGYRRLTLHMPVPMFNIMNGGAHTNWQTTDFQEFMIVPRTARTFKEAMEIGSEIYHHLKELLKKKGFSTLVGDEGGFAPDIKGNEAAVELILEAIHQAGLKAGYEVSLALDPATSELYEHGSYFLKKEQRRLRSEELVELWTNWVEKYPIISIEDGLAEDDWAGWQLLKRKLGHKILLVGDDFLVTNPERIERAIQEQTCNALLMKINQIGTLSESLQAIMLSRGANWKIIVSHRSGETEDTSIADIAVGTDAEFVKIGAPARSERTAKYNQLLRIEEGLG
jgi:enolase